MPPPHRILTSSLRGYVCRACLSKSQLALQQKPLWLSRNATNGRRRRPQSKGAQEEVNQQIPIVRLFEQTPDGRRVEIKLDDPLEGTEEMLREYEEDKDKSMEELSAPLDFESFRNSNGHYDKHLLDMDESLTDVDKDDEELDALMERLDNIDFSKLSSEDRAKLREEVLGTATNDEDAPLAVADPQSSAAPIARLTKTKISINSIPVEVFKKQHQYHLHLLNRAIANNQKAPRRTSRSVLPSAGKDIWKAYLHCQNAIRSAPGAVPSGVWETLWNKFDAQCGSNLDRMRRIKTLGEDMSSANIQLSSAQTLLYIESIFVAGDRNIALREWEAARYLERDQVKFKAYCELGIRIYCQTGNIPQAVRIANKCLHNSKDPTRFRILLPVMQACLESDEDRSVQRAWALYMRMRFIFGPQLAMEDYDAVVSMFMNANEPDLALGVFKDMMLTGNSSVDEQDSMSIYKKVISVDQLDSINIKDRELDWEHSHVLINLPARFKNKFFFGKWIRKLISEGKLDAARQVFELMQVRGVKPDSRHMNGLIGAWFRQGTEKYRVLAEEMAWRMIQARLDYIKSRNPAYNIQTPLRAVKTFEPQSSKSLNLVPSATIETFSILLEQYRRRQQPELVNDLYNALRSTRIRPSTFFLNNLLNYDLRSYHPNSAWKTYAALTQETDVRPDFDTYEILWTLLKRTLEPIRSHRLTGARHLEAAKSCRQLFADMMTRGFKEGLTRDLYNLIISSFALDSDQVGTAVALRALQRHFGMYPDEETTRIIVKNLAPVGLIDEFGNKPIRYSMRAPAVKERIANVAKLLEIFMNQRIEVLSQQGIIFNALDGDAKAEEMLLLLSDLLRYVAQAKLVAEVGHNWDVVSASETAAEKMGVPECVPWTAHIKSEVENVYL